MIDHHAWDHDPCPRCGGKPDGAWIDVVHHRPTTYVVRCAEHGDDVPRTQYGIGRVTIFQGHNAYSDARRYVREHNAIQH